MKPNLAIVDRAPVKKLPKGVATHRSVVIGKRVIWCWRPLTSLQRIDVQHSSRPAYFDAAHLDRVLEARTIGTHAKRRVKR